MPNPNGVHFILDVDGTISSSSGYEYNDALLSAIKETGATEVVFATSMSVGELLNYSAEISEGITPSTYPRSQMVKDLQKSYGLTVKDIVMTADGAPGVEAGFMYKHYYQPIAKGLEDNNTLNGQEIQKANAYLLQAFGAKGEKLEWQSPEQMQKQIRAALEEYPSVGKLSALDKQMVEAAIVENHLSHKCTAEQNRLNVEQKNLLVQKSIEKNGAGTCFFADDKEKEVNSVQQLNDPNGTRVITLQVNMKVFELDKNKAVKDPQQAEAEKQKYQEYIQKAQQAQEAQFQLMMVKSSEMAMQKIMDVTGLKSDQLEVIYKERLIHIDKYFRDHNKENLSQLHDFKGFVAELTALEYEAFRKSDIGKAAIKDGTIQKNWMESLVGEGGVKLYNSLARAVGLGEISLAKDNFAKLKQEAQDAVIAIDFKSKHMVGLCLETTELTKIVKLIAEESNLSLQAKKDLALEYINNIATQQTMLPQRDIAEAITGLKRLNSAFVKQIEELNKLEEICQKAGLTSPAVAKGPHVTALEQQKQNRGSDVSRY